MKLATTQRLVISTAAFAILSMLSDGVVTGAAWPKLGEKIRVRPAHKRELTGYFAGLKDSVLYLTSGGEISIDRIVTQQNDTITCSFGGARYTPDTDSLGGLKSDGTPMSLALADVSAVEVVYISKERRDRVVFDQRTVRNRFRQGVKYPELHSVPVDSVNSLKVWHESNNLVMAAGILAGIAVGAIAAGGESTDTSYEQKEFLWAHWTDTIVNEKDLKVIRDLFAGAGLGLAVGYLFGRSRWRDVISEEPEVTVSPYYKHRIGVSLSIRF